MAGKASTSWMRAAGAGTAAGAAGLAIGELVAAVPWPRAAPLVAVGDSVIAWMPEGVTRWAIDVFGAWDKTLLGLAVVAVVCGGATVVAATAGRWRAVLPVAVSVVTALGMAAAVSRPGANLWWAVPCLCAGVATAVVLWALSHRWRGFAAPEDDPRLFARRRFLAVTTGITGGAVVAGWVARGWGQSAAVEASRGKIKLPAPHDPAPALPSGARLKVPGLTPWRIGNAGFYRIDTALTVPRIDPGEYRLRIWGRVGRELNLSYEDLLRMPLIERDITLNCVSNEVGGELVGNARWLGVSLQALLDEAKPGQSADQLVGRSSDGFTAGAPLRTCRDGRDAMLAVGMNGEPLPLEHGFPVRMIVPGLYGYVSATKWLTELEVTSFDAYDAYWIERDWALPEPVKTASRIDTPGSSVSAGRVPVAGVAWAQHRGISRVEVRVDDGDWHEAELSAKVSDDVWRQWVWTWDADPGEHTLTVRATDGQDDTQTSQVAPVVPSGATGWHTVTVTVEP